MNIHTLDPPSRGKLSRLNSTTSFLLFFFFLPASLPFLVVKGIYLVTLDLSSIFISIPRLRRSWIVEVTIDRAILMSKLALNRVWKNSLSLRKKGWSVHLEEVIFDDFAAWEEYFFLRLWYLIGWELYGIIQFRETFVEIYVLRVTCLMYE